MASITPHQQGWRVQLSVKGQRDSKTFAGKREAQLWAERRGLEMRAHATGKTGDVKSLRDAMHRFAVEISPSHKGHSWELVRLHAIEQHEHLPFTLPLNKLTADHFRRWKEWRSTQVSPATVTREMNLLGSVLSHAKRDWGWMSGQPLADVRRPPKTPNRERVITWRETKGMLRELGYRPHRRPKTMKELAAFAMLLALRTGMRAGELTGTRWVDVHASWIYLPDTKNGSGREVPLSSKARLLVKRLRDLDEDAMLPISAQSLDALFRKARGRAGLEGFTFHDTRHTAATRIGATVGQIGRVSFPEFCKIFGWKDPKNALIYVNPSAADLADKL